MPRVIEETLTAALTGSGASLPSFSSLSTFLLPLLSSGQGRVPLFLKNPHVLQHIHLMSAHFYLRRASWNWRHMSPVRDS